MKRTSFSVSAMLVVGLLLFASGPSFALWVEEIISANGVVNGQQFTVTTKDAEPFKVFEVTLAPHPRDVSPFMTGTLSLIANDKWVASVPVSETRENGVSTYSFRVTPDAIGHSTFEISASGYAPAGKGKSYFGTAMLGKRKVEQVMGGTIYKLELKDFVKKKNG